MGLEAMANEEGNPGLEVKVHTLHTDVLNKAIQSTGENLSATLKVPPRRPLSQLRR